MALGARDLIHEIDYLYQNKEDLEVSMEHWFLLWYLVWYEEPGLKEVVLELALELFNSYGASTDIIENI